MTAANQQGKKQTFTAPVYSYAFFESGDSALENGAKFTSIEVTLAWQAKVTSIFNLRFNVFSCIETQISYSGVSKWLKVLTPSQFITHNGVEISKIMSKTAAKLSDRQSK